MKLCKLLPNETLTGNNHNRIRLYFQQILLGILNRSYEK